MITLIAAIGHFNEIGSKNQLLWKNSHDMARFREYTLGKTVIMGRKTYESIGRPLPGRLNIVISSKPIIGVITAANVITALNIQKNTKEVCIIGGSSVYNQTINLADKLVITHINQTFINADSYFPEIDEKWSLDCRINYNGYSFAEYVRLPGLDS